MFRSQDETILREVLPQYGFRTRRCTILPLGRGNINATFLVQHGSAKYVLQRISRAVFPDPEVVAANFRLVTEHIRETAESVAPYYCTPKLITTSSGDYACRDATGEWWRLQTYIDHIPAEDLLFASSHAVELGRILGTFHALTARLDPTQLYDPLPGFHITPQYLANFDRTVDGRSVQASHQLENALHFVERYRSLATSLVELHKNGVVPVRTIHGDPKLDNIIFSPSGSAVGLFDLDTVGPGLRLWDIGDCLRSCCNSSGEDAHNPATVVFDLELCRSVLFGYFNVGFEQMNTGERSAIFEATAVMTYELGLRFLLDHLQGDVYFRVRSRGENLHCALVQFHLLDSVMTQEDQFRTMLMRNPGEE